MGRNEEGAMTVMTKMRNFRAGAICALLSGLLVLAFPVQAQEQEEPAQEQGGDGLMGGFSNDPDAPIEIEADTLEVEQNQKTATFIGSVHAIQGTMHLTSDRLVVTYAEKQTGGNEITQIDARGNVHVFSPEDDQSADGNWAIYDTGKRIITMGDDVLLRQGDNVIRGKKLFINMNTGQARVDAGAADESGTPGRVRGLFQPSEDGGENGGGAGEN